MMVDQLFPYLTAMLVLTVKRLRIMRSRQTGIVMALNALNVGGSLKLKLLLRPDCSGLSFLGI